MTFMCRLCNMYHLVCFDQGVSREKVRWQKCVEYVNERMGMAVGRLFVRDNFDVESKHTVSYAMLFKYNRGPTY